MVSIKSKMFNAAKSKVSELVKACSAVKKKYGTQMLTFMLVYIFPRMVFAQVSGAPTDGSGMFCWIAMYFKQIVGTAAVVAIFMWAIEHIFGASKLHDITIKVGVACGLVIAGATFVRSSGLAISCQI